MMFPCHPLRSFIVNDNRFKIADPKILKRITSAKRGKVNTRTHRCKCGRGY